MRTEHENFRAVVADIWRDEVSGSPSFRFGEKLQRLRYKLRSWNWEVFGDIQEKIKTLEAEIQCKEERSQSTLLESDYQELELLKTELAKNMNWEYELYRQKTRVK